MDTEDLSFNDSANSEVVEDFSAVLPWVCVSILANGLIVETVDSSYLSGFVVASQQSDVSGVLQLQAE